MAPAHPHATGVAVYPALFSITTSLTFGIILDPEFREENFNDVVSFEHVIHSDRGNGVELGHENARLGIVNVAVN